MNELELKLENPSSTNGIVKASISNNSNRSIRVLKWGTPFDENDSDCLIVIINESQACEYIGARYKRLFDLEKSTFIVPSRSTVSIEIHVPSKWHIPKPGKYKIALKLRNLTVINNNEKSDNINEYDFNEIRISSQPIEIDILNIKRNDFQFPINENESANIRMPSNQEIDRIKENDFSIPKCPPDFLCISPAYSGNGDCYRGRYIGHPKMASDQADLGAIKNYIDLKKCSIDYTMSNKGEWKLNDDPIYKKWFGEYNSERAQKVVSALIALTRPEKCFSFNIYIDRSNNTDAVAYWMKSSDPKSLSVIGLTMRYFKLKEGGVDSRIGTIAHELSHAFAGTVDHAYGVNNCIRLAKISPEYAIENADSYQYFVEEKIGLRPRISE